MYKVITHNMYNWYSKNSYCKRFNIGLQNAMHSNFGKNLKTDYGKVVIKLLMGEGHFIVIWETSKRAPQAGSSPTEPLNRQLHNGSPFPARLTGSARTSPATLSLSDWSSS